jgi:predicted Mrr-cat superfamily restriction endonuclease
MELGDKDLETKLKKYSKFFEHNKKTTNQSRTGRSLGRRTQLPPSFFQQTDDLLSISQTCKLLWKISPGKKGHEWELWINPDGSGRIAIGWDDDEIGALSNYQDQQTLKTNIEKNRRKWGGDWIKRGPNGGLKDPSWYVAQQLWRFYKETEKDQTVIAYSKKTIFAVGRIIGDYEFVDNMPFFGHWKAVKWYVAPGLPVRGELVKVLGKRATIYAIKSLPSIRKIFNSILRDKKRATSKMGVNKNKTPNLDTDHLIEPLTDEKKEEIKAIIRKISAEDWESKFSLELAIRFKCKRRQIMGIKAHVHYPESWRK